MLNKNRTYTAEFKQEALALLESSDRPAAVIERELGITAGLLSRWYRKQQKNEPMGDGENVSEEKRRIRELERENAILRQEREILKKAVAIFAPPRG